jgi:hypothetical protein
MMSSSANGRQGSPREPLRRLRYDDLSAILARSSARVPGPPGAPASPWLPRSHSGRRFVILAALAVLAIWGVLDLVFRDWRARYRRRAAYGASHVAPAIDPMAETVPPGVDPAAWRDAVSRTHDMLRTVAASNLLGLDEIQRLRAELDAAVARARPETARAELAAVWDAIADRAEFLLKDGRSADGERHRRPDVLPSYAETRVAPALDPLAELVPPGVEPAAWRDALSRTRARLRRVADSSRLGVAPLQALRRRLDAAVTRARAEPRTAVAELTRLWDEILDRGGSRPQDGRAAVGDRPPRPEILSPRR